MPQFNFTLDQCNNSLVHLSPIVRDIVKKMAAIEAVQKKANELGSEPAVLENCLPELKRAKELLKEIEHHLAELAEVGVIARDLSMGLVDFPAEKDGKPIFYCWMLGENSVSFWHGEKEGFAERKHLGVGSRVSTV